MLCRVFARVCSGGGLIASTALCLCLCLWLAQPVAAFCGFYVSGADSDLYANATMVVLMRSGTRTVLSMQNNYQGPPDEFAVVIPVPTVLQKDQVKVLPPEVFRKVDALGAPRLVEYWERDPCYQPPPPPQLGLASTAAAASRPTSAPGASSAPPPVRIEAQFSVGEYDVVILSADDSAALDRWLRDNAYNIPQGAKDVLAPYIAAGMKFFVAKVDPARVHFNGNQAALSPLRFHYDSKAFSLPIRLGLLNSQGSQDLIVNILASQRYEVANYPNVTVPTNLRVRDQVQKEFGSFYEALFSRLIERNPGAVVTEYAWAANTCDPCPTPALTPTELATLGADVLQTPSTAVGTGAAGSGSSANAGQTGRAPSSVLTSVPQLTLTRLHARYTRDMLGDDLVFRQASAIAGGRGIPDRQGLLDPTVRQQGSFSNFQGRYVNLHPWSGAITCSNPVRGVWGGPSGRSTPRAQASSNTALAGTPQTAGDLSELLAESIPALSVAAAMPLAPLDVAPSGASASGLSAHDSAIVRANKASHASLGIAGARGDATFSMESAAEGTRDTGCAVAPRPARRAPIWFVCLAAVWVYRARSRRWRRDRGVQPQHGSSRR